MYLHLDCYYIKGATQTTTNFFYDEYVLVLYKQWMINVSQEKDDFVYMWSGYK